MILKVLGSSSSGNCYLLQSKEESLLLECGLSYKEILKGIDFDLSNLKGCLITHSHNDHCKAVKELAIAGVDIGLSHGTFQELISTKDLKNYSHRMKFLKHKKIEKFGGFKVTSFNAMHDTKEPLCFLIYHEEMGSLLFLTDSYYSPYAFNNVEHILIECNYSEDILDELPKHRARVLESHMSLETLKSHLENWDLSKTKTITLIHLSDSNSEPKRFKKEIKDLTNKEVNIATKDLILELER